jgi:hypothetical protein
MGRGVLAAIAVTFAMLGVPSAAAAQGDDIAERLKAIPGMTLVEERAAPAPYRFFVLSYRQPADHTNASAGSFGQRFTLLHKTLARAGPCQPLREIALQHRFLRSVACGQTVSRGAASDQTGSGTLVLPASR